MLDLSKNAEDILNSTAFEHVHSVGTERAC